MRFNPERKRAVIKNPFALFLNLNLMFPGPEKYFRIFFNSTFSNPFFAHSGSICGGVLSRTSNFSQLPSAGLQNYLLFQVENMPAARKEDMGPEIWKLSEISAPPGNVHLRRQGSLCVTYWYCLRHLKTLYLTNTEIHKYNLRPFTGGSWNLSWKLPWWPSVCLSVRHQLTPFYWIWLMWHFEAPVWSRFRGFDEIFCGYFAPIPF